MHRPLRSFAVIAALVAVIVVAVEARRSAAEPAQRSRAEFMRKKLELSKNLLEGLTLENFALIEQNARDLRKLSLASDWEVKTIPNVTDYLHYTTEFRRYCDDLGRKARDRNLDGATVSFTQLTLNCVRCHQFVREGRAPEPATRP